MAALARSPLPRGPGARLPEKLRLPMEGLALRPHGPRGTGLQPRRGVTGGSDPTPAARTFRATGIGDQRDSVAQAEDEA